MVWGDWRDVLRELYKVQAEASRATTKSFAMEIRIGGSFLAWLIFVRIVVGWTPANLGRTQHNQRHQVSKTSSPETTEDMNKKIGNCQVSVAGSYSIAIRDSTWSLYRIDQVVDDKGIIADGARSMQAVTSTPLTTIKPTATLSCDLSTPNALKIGLSTNAATISDDDLQLVDLLQRIYVQWFWFNLGHESRSDSQQQLSLFQEGRGIRSLGMGTDSSLEVLFGDIVDTSSSTEWVEMVTGDGAVLGKVPRRLVHTFNLLHRGIGIFVTKDRPINHSEDDFPSLYVHRRCAAKRIFPSMYDMFVGGVSMADEPPELTARRELAEELGLSRALDDPEALSDPILVCTVCTGYNRCVVTLFSYTMNTKEETVTWQEEEVDWGSFVPYPVIVAAADRSIERFAEAKTWPGTYPAIQSAYKGELPGRIEYENDAWKQWDFVPDGLLVWETWLHFLKSSKVVQS